MKLLEAASVSFKGYYFFDPEIHQGNAERIYIHSILLALKHKSELLSDARFKEYSKLKNRRTKLTTAITYNKKYLKDYDKSQNDYNKVEKEKFAIIETITSEISEVDDDLKKLEEVLSPLRKRISVVEEILAPDWAIPSELGGNPEKHIHFFCEDWKPISSISLLELRALIKVINTLFVKLFISSHRQCIFKDQVYSYDWKPQDILYSDKIPDRPEPPTELHKSRLERNSETVSSKKSSKKNEVEGEIPFALIREKLPLTEKPVVDY